MNTSSSLGASRAEARWQGSEDVGLSERWTGQRLCFQLESSWEGGKGMDLQSDRPIGRTQCVRMRVSGCVWRIVVAKVDVWM